MNYIDITIGALALISYLIGFYAIFKNGYRPNLFTRIVWLGLALNNFISVIKLGNQSSTISLALITLVGSLLIFIGAWYFKGDRFFGKTEYISTVLLLISLMIWIFTDIPLLNLSIGLLAHTIGSIPTIVSVVKDPKSENIPFWFFFALASILALSVTNTSNIKDSLFVIYFCVFDSIMVILALRRYLNK